MVMATGDLLMAIVKDSPARLVHHIGYGNAAGYLYMKGIRKDQLQTNSSEDPRLSSDDQDIKQNGVKELAQAEPHESPHMTEEEKEAEAVRLLDLFERLEKTGIVKVMRE